jgi:hypothetical protein
LQAPSESLGSKSAREDIDETTSGGTLVRTEEMRFSLQVLAYRLPSMNLEVHGGKGKSQRPPRSCSNWLKPCCIDHRAPRIVSCLEKSVDGILALPSLPLAAAFAESRGLPVESKYSYRGLNII